MCRGLKGKQFNPTVLGYAQTREGHFKRVQNESIRFNASAHHRPLEHFNRMQPATTLIGNLHTKGESYIYLFIYLFIYFYYNKPEVHLSYYRAP